MLEAEVKLRIDEPAAERLREHLQTLGASTGAPVHQRDIYFAHPNRDFSKTDEALRLRFEERGLFVTYKGKKLDPPRKTREEIEFPLATDPETATLLLQRLGFTIVATVEKLRSEFTLTDPSAAIVSIDRIEGLGLFCEVEVSADTVEQGREGLARFLTKLNLEDRSPIPESYLELLIEMQ